MNPSTLSRWGTASVLVFIAVIIVFSASAWFSDLAEANSPNLTPLSSRPSSFNTPIGMDKDAKSQSGAFLIGNTDGHDLIPAVDFCGANYLVVWGYELEGTPTQYGVLGRLISPLGSNMGDPYAISLGTDFNRLEPDVAYNSGGPAEYLVVWQQNYYAEADIRARRVRQDGIPLAPEIPVALSSNLETSPAVASNSNTVEWLIVYEYYNGSNTDIRGQRISATGELIGTAITIAQGSNDQASPDIVFLPIAEQYLVVWEEWTTGPEANIYGQRVSQDGGLLGGNFLITGNSNWDIEPSLTANTQDGEFLLTWSLRTTEAEESHTILAQRISATGNLIAESIPIFQGGGTPRHQSAVAYHPDVNEYLVTWEETYLPNPADHDIFSRRVSADGTLPAGAETVAYTTAWEGRPALAPDHVLSYLVVWEDTRDAFTQAENIYGNLLRLDQFQGGVYQGNLGDYSHPLAGVSVVLRCSNTVEDPGFICAQSGTDEDGLYSLIAPSGYSYYNIEKINPFNYFSVGASSIDGVVISSNQIQYASPLAGKVLHANNFFLQPIPTPTFTVTITLSPTITSTITPSPTRTSTPSPTPTRTMTPSPSPTRTPSPTPTRTSTPSPTPSRTMTPSPTSSFSPSPSFTNSPSPSPTFSPSPSSTVTPSLTPSRTPTSSPTPTATSSSSITIIHFDDLAAGMHVDEQYASSGVHFLSDYYPSFSFFAGPQIINHPAAKSPPNVLVNDFYSSEMFSSSDKPLVVWFDEPVYGVGMQLLTANHNGTTCDGTYTATINVYDCHSNLIATRSVSVNRYAPTPLEIDDPLGRIQRIWIDYGSTTCPEAIDELAFMSGPGVCTDTIVPNLVVVSPPDGSIFNTPGIVIQGNFRLFGLLKSATINGARMPVYMSDPTGTYQFRYPTTLHPGSNLFSVQAKNHSGVIDSESVGYMLGAPSQVTLKEFHLTQRGVIKNTPCDIDSPMIALKSGLARIKLDVTTATGAPAYVTGVDMRIYRWDAAGDILTNTIQGVSYPSNYPSFNSAGQMDEILFWFSGDDVSIAGSHRFEFQPYVGITPFGPPLQMTCGGSAYKFFSLTKPLKLLLVPVEAGMNSPVLSNTSHNDDLMKQLMAVARTFPLGDNIYPNITVKIQETSPFKMCDGTSSSVNLYPNICLGTGWLWKHIDKDPSGLLKRSWADYVFDQTKTFCSVDDHIVGGSEKGSMLINYIFDPALGILRPGAHPGWCFYEKQPDKHAWPIDEDHDNDIDNADLSLYIRSFYDMGQDKWLLFPNSYYNPGETFRFFYDTDGNNCNNTAVDWEAPIVQKFDRETIFWKPEEMAINQQNAAIPGTVNDFTNSILVFPKSFIASQREFGDVGPGRGQTGGNLVWIPAGANSALSHELGHNVGSLDDQYFDNVPDDLLTKEQAIDVYINQHEVAPNQVIVTMGGTVAYNRAIHYKPDYLALFNKLKVPNYSEMPDSEPDSPVFVLSGLIESDGSLSHLQSSQTSGLETTPVDPTSPYILRFGSGTTSLLDFPFNIGVNATPPEGFDDWPVLTQMFNVISPYPAGSTWVEVRKNGEVLARLEQSQNPPAIQVLTPNGGEVLEGYGEFVVSWSSFDTDENDLLHNIFFSADGGQTWNIVAAGIGGNQFTWSLADVPGTHQGLIRVEVSDGFLRGTDESDASFVVAEKPPLVSIEAPGIEQQILQCSTIHLSGAAYDPEGMEITINWSVDGVEVGTSLELTIPSLLPGVHDLKLLGTDSGGLQDESTRTFVILPDADCDEMADGWEVIQLFDSANPLDAAEDADSDGLSNRAEYFWNLDPHNPDSDGDGVEDGDEINQGTDPSFPNTYWIYLPTVLR